MTDLTPNSLCPQGEHAPGPEPLSPAAQAVLDAYYNAAKAVLDICGDFEIGSARNEGIAAALRALVLKCEYCDDYGTSFIDPKDILAIATELEGTNDPA